MAIIENSICVPSTRTFERIAGANSRLNAIAERLEYAINRVEGPSYGSPDCDSFYSCAYRDEVNRLEDATERLSKLVENIEQHI